MKGIKAKEIVRLDTIDRSTWLKMKRGGIGGSEASAIVGLNPYKDVSQLFLDKQHVEFEPDNDIIEEENQYMYWGNRLEPVVADEAQLRLRELVAPYDVVEYKVFLEHNKHPFIIANVDRLVMKNGSPTAVLECKTGGVSRAKDWTDDRPPAGYIAQVMHYMMVTGLKKAYLACLIGGQRFVLKSVRRDDGLMKLLEQAELDFWKYVEVNVMPLELSQYAVEVKEGILEGIADGSLVDGIYDSSQAQQ